MKNVNKIIRSNGSIIILTDKELEVIEKSAYINYHWGNAGSFGDGSDITDKKGYNTLIKALKKLGYVVKK